MNKPATARSLIRFALVVAAGIAAATVTVCAQNRPEQGLLLDAQTWNDEVLTADSDPWPQDGWYRLVAGTQGIEVRAAHPGERASIPVDALFFRLPGTTLQPGMHASYAQQEMLQPVVDRPGTIGRFSLRVEEADAGVQYAIGYGGHSYTYIVGPRGASTSVRAVADVDGDGRPDFVVDADDSTFLLLSTRAQPGPNLPTAELPAHGGC